MEEEKIKTLEKRVFALEKKVKEGYTIKNKTLAEKIEKAEETGRYLVLISRLEGETLYHDYVTNDFKTDDIFSSVKHLAERLKKEVIVKREQ